MAIPLTGLLLLVGSIIIGVTKIVEALYFPAINIACRIRLYQIAIRAQWIAIIVMC